MAAFQGGIAAVRLWAGGVGGQIPRWHRLLRAMSSAGPLLEYQKLVEQGKVAEDPTQQVVVAQLDSLHSQLRLAERQGLVPRNVAATASAPQPRRESSSFFSSVFNMGGMFGGKSTSASTQPTAPVASAHSAPASFPGLPKGKYVYGGVGSGKTFLMDMWFDHVSTRRKRRVHFNAFMLDVHARLHALRTSGGGGGGGADPLQHIAQDILRESYVLAFDEFQVTDVGDAMIMARLFGSLFEGGLVMVATSNRHPSELYKQGLQRELFMPVIDAIAARCDVVRLNSPTDYRLLGTQAGHTWITPESLQGVARTRNMEQVSAELEKTFRSVSKDEVPRSTLLTTQGRTVEVRRAALDRGVAFFSFEELCAQPLGAADYMVIAQRFPIVFLDDVPALSLGERNEVRRLITLVDTLYEHKVKLFVSAALPAHELFKPGGHSSSAAARTGTVDSLGVERRLTMGDEEQYGGADEVFAFDRAVSRLIKMGSTEYLKSQWLPNLHKSGAN